MAKTVTAYIETKLCAPENALPEALRQRQVRAEAERALCAELIRTAVDDYRGGPMTVCGMSPTKAMQRAHAWLASTIREAWRVSFEDAAEAIGVDAGKIRQGLGIVPERRANFRPWQPWRTDELPGPGIRRTRIIGTTRSAGCSG